MSAVLKRSGLSHFALDGGALEIGAVSEQCFEVNGRSYTATVAGEGPVVLCLHGFPDTKSSFRYQLVALVKAGFRVVCPYMPGYELSSLKDNHYYDLEYLGNEINALVGVISAEPVHIVGHDWGAIAAYAAVGKKPKQYASLTALTIPYNMISDTLIFKSPKQIVYSWYIAFFQLRGVAEYVMKAKGFNLIDKLYRDWSPNWIVPEEQLKAIKAVLSDKRLKQAALGYYRALRSPSAKKYMHGDIHLPTLLVRGEDDGCIYAGTWKLINSECFKKGLTIESVKAGHFLHIEKPKEVNSILLAHLALHAEG